MTEYISEEKENFSESLDKIDSLIKEKYGNKEDGSVESRKGLQSIELDNILSVKKGKKRELYDEKTGFGWNGLGSRRIVFDKDLEEYIYKVNEPKLSESEKELKEKLVFLFGVNADIDVKKMSNKAKNRFLHKMLEKIIKDNHIEVHTTEKNHIFYYIFQDFIGYGKIDILMNDVGIEDISCDGIDTPVFIYHKDLGSIRTNIVFKSSDELDNYVVKLAQICGKQISVYSPIVDGKLPDGSRLSVTLSKTVTTDSNFTIRRFREDPMTPVDLIAGNTLNLDMAAYFWLAIEHGNSVIFCGGTASGKTTALNALALFIPFSSKIVSIEDTREVNLPHENWIAGSTRQGLSQSDSEKSSKDIDMFDLTRAALRQRPRVIIVGEVRGREAYNLFQAMTTGHLSYSTVHAGDIRTLIQRLESPPISLPRSLLTALDIIVFLNSTCVDDKLVRRVTNVMEIIKLDSETNRLITFTPFTWSSSSNDEFHREDGSRILSKIKKERGWSEEELHRDLENRKRVLSWMVEKNVRNYQEVSKVITKFQKNPQSILKQIEEDKK